MKNLFLFLILIFTLTGCNSSDDGSITGSTNLEYKWSIPTENISGSLNLFPLANNPIMTAVKDIDFIASNSRVAMVRFGNETRIYPYSFISKYEAVNDKIDDVTFTMTYCPNTKSGLVFDRKFKIDNFTIRASGYLYQDNQVLIDAESDTFWSQMLIKCVKGKYAGERINTFNFVETRWSTVKEFFPDALVFTNTSIKNKSADTKKDNIVKGDLTFGILDLKLSQNESVHLFPYDGFTENTKLKTVRISNEEILVIGNKEKQFITSYINDNSQVDFKVLQDQFPIIMEDSNGNKWDVFGIAISGSRKGDQLESLPSFFALGWAWESFYTDVVIEY